ncbi:MAG: hypothetical protein FJ138_09185 [Deltaproteobacteria bacterium]|nr:hypothetical protein [Deltaproteobacteria bacterium]
MNAPLTPVLVTTPWPRGAAALEETLARLSVDALELLRADVAEPVRAPLPPEEAARRHTLALPARGAPLHAVMDDVVALLRAAPATSGPRFFNQLFAGRDPVAAPADMLASLANHSMYTYKVAGPLVLMELEVLRGLRRALGYPEGEGGGLFAPGGSLSNLAAMLCARDHAFGPSAREEGLPREARLYTSAEDHYSVRKGAGVMGLGRAHVVAVECDAEGRMRPDLLAARLRADRAAGLRPMMINATAGTTVRGAFDPLDALADVAAGEGGWLHVDGAFGGAALWSPRLRPLCAGAARADSFTWDAHKAMGVPLTCSALLTRDPLAPARALSESASYLFQADGDALNPGTRSLQCGRRDDALKLWAAWRYHGDEGWAARADRLRDLALALADEVRRRPRLRLTEEPPFLNVCFEYVGRSSEEVCERLRLTRRALVGYALMGGRAVVRAAVVNPELTLNDLRALLDAVEEVAPACAPSSAR